MVTRSSLLGFLGLVFSVVTLFESTLHADPLDQPQVNCLSGDPKLLGIESQLSGKSTKLKDNAFLEGWKIFAQFGEPRDVASTFFPYDRSCPSAMIVPVDDVDPLARFIQNDFRPDLNRAKPQRLVSRSCIETAIVKRKVGGVANIICDTDSSNGRRGKTKLASEPCLTAAYVDYLHWTLNNVLECLGGSGAPLDPQLAFKKLNLESAFRGFIQSERGIGLAQLTTTAAKEMSFPGAGYRFLDSLMLRNPKACKPFMALANTPLQLDNGYAGHCQFVSMGGGMARNLLKGFGLYLYYRDAMPGASVTQMLTQAGLKGNKDFDKMRDYLALVSFSAEGPLGAQVLFSKIRNKVRVSTPFSQFKALVDAQTDYTTKMDQAMTDLFGDPNRNCLEDHK